MDARLIGLLKKRLTEAQSLYSHGFDSSTFVTWRAQTESTLNKSLGPQHHIAKEFETTSWEFADNERYFQQTLLNSEGLLQAAISEIEELAQFEEQEENGGVDAELWEHISKLVAAEAWGQVASQTAIFTEDRIRKWTGRPAHEVGEKLMTAAVGDKGEYRLGLIDSEKQGWHRLAMGISMALRNADAHRIQKRNDHKQYAMGVVGVSSLLLTQLRYEHGNRFHDQSSVTTEPPEPEDI